MKRSIPWVKGRVGSLFHPIRRGRVLYFKRSEVEEVQRKEEAAISDGEKALVALFERHSENPDAHPLERLMALSGVEPGEIKRLHTRWANARRFQGLEVPSIRTREEIRKGSELAILAMHKHYDAEVAALDKKAPTIKKRSFFDLDTVSPARAKRREARESRIEAMQKRLLGD
jgi:hypothetical protein